MRKLPLIVALVSQGLAVLLLAISIFGDAATGHQLLSFLTPEARAVVMSNTTLIILLVLSYGLSSWLLIRDYGKGTDALESLVETQTEAREALRAALDWKAEFLAKEEGMLASVGALEAKFEQTVAALHARLQEYVETSKGAYRVQLEEVRKQFAAQLATTANMHSVEGMLATVYNKVVSEFDETRKKADEAHKTVGGLHDWQMQLSLANTILRSAEADAKTFQSLVDRAEALEGNIAEAERRIADLINRQAEQDGG